MDMSHFVYSFIHRWTYGQFCGNALDLIHLFVRRKMSHALKEKWDFGAERGVVTHEQTQFCLYLL
jgi:hypothetical protein